MNEVNLFNFGVDCDFNANVANDVLIGGHSESRVFISARAQAVFSGHLSDFIQNCFASVRFSKHNLSLEGIEGLYMKVMGDGKRYECRLRTQSQLDEIEYVSEFQTKKNEWMLVKLPFKNFIPIYRGHYLNNVSPIDPKSIQQICFFVSHHSQSGDFQLVFDWINAYRTNQAIVNAYAENLRYRASASDKITAP